MSRGVQYVKQTKSTRTIRNPIYSPSQQTQTHSHLKSLQWTSSPSCLRQRDTTQSLQSRTTIAPRRLYLSPATRPSLVKESQNCTYNTRTHTTDSPSD